jgi:hypothetical protein
MKDRSWDAEVPEHSRTAGVMPVPHIRGVMPLEPSPMFPVFDTQDQIPEGFRDDYEERDGKWHPKVPDVTNLKTALESERQRAEREEKARKDAERERDNLRRQGSAKEKGVTEEQLDALRQEDAQKRAAEMTPLQAENAELKKKLRKVTHADRVRAMALEAGIMPDRIEDAMLILVDGPNARTDLTEDGESIVVKSKKGELTTEKIEDFLAKTFREEKSWYYGGTGSSGSDFGRPGPALETPPGTQPTNRTQEHRTRAAAAF